jgi:tripartite ATP-independent transporter DctP family solute receptor
MSKYSKQFLMAISIGTIAALLLPRPTLASRMISVAFNSHMENPQQVGADGLRQKLATLLGKEIVVDARVGNALGSENAVLAATRSGAIDVSVLSGGVVSGVVPEMSVFDIPFLFRDEAQAKTVMQGPVAARIATKFADKGLVLLALGKQGFRQLTNSKRPIRTPADLHGIKLRVVSNDIYTMSFKALGADAVPMDFPLVYGALKDGRLDGQENPPTTIKASRFSEVQKYMSVTDHIFAPIAFVANRAMFEQLDPAEQEALIAAAKAGAETTWQATLDTTRLQQLRGDGMEVVDKIDRQAFIDALKPLEPEFEKRFGKELIAAIRSTK